MLSIIVIDQINDMKMKLGSKLKLRKIGKTKVDMKFQQRLSTQPNESASKRVPLILMAGLRSASYMTKRKDRTLTRANLEMELLSQCGECIVRDFRPSCMHQ